MIRPNKCGLGIATGDVVTTSYGTGPYEVWDVHGPYLWTEGVGDLVIYRYPIISLTLIKPGEQRPGHQDHHFYINYIARVGHRWLSGRDEIFVEKRQVSGQMDLFGPTEKVPEPYPFQEGVDYSGPLGTTRHCWMCKRDFNAVRTEPWCGPACPDPKCCGVGYNVMVFPDTQLVTSNPREETGRCFATMVAWNNALPVEVAP